jgi:hypothetical protein
MFRAMIADARPVPFAPPITGRVAWRREDLQPVDWLVRPADETLAELDRLARQLAGYEGELAALRLEAPTALALMADIRRRLVEGVGFAVLDGLPSNAWTEQGARAVAWLLCNAVAPAVMQKWSNPARMYEVRDTGARHGYGVRRSLTNLRQDLHTDGPWLAATAPFMGLACVRQATDGGMSYLASLAAVHNRLRAEAPQLLERLYRPFYWDRQAEHAPDDVKASFLPVFAWDGERLKVRYYDDYIRSGYKLIGAELDQEGVDALAAMQAIIDAPEHMLEFRLLPGQVLFCNNQIVAHGRSAFTETGATPRGRLLLRFWLRPQGGTGFEAAA